MIFDAISELVDDLNDNGWETDDIVACGPAMDSDIPTLYFNFNLPYSALHVLSASWDASPEELRISVEDTFYAVGYAGHIQARAAVQVALLRVGSEFVGSTMDCHHRPVVSPPTPISELASATRVTWIYLMRCLRVGICETGSGFGRCHCSFCERQTICMHE